MKYSRPKDDNDLIPTRKSLLSRLKNWEDEESWREFFDTYWKLIYRAALRAGLTEAEAQDAVQDTLVSVAKSMPEFEYRKTRSSFKSWLLQLTSWRVTDQLRKRKPNEVSQELEAGTSTGTAAIERIPDPATSELAQNWDAEWEVSTLETAIARVKKQTHPKQYQIFDCYYFKGWPVTRVARAFDVNVAHVYVTKHRISKLLKQEVEGLQKQPVYPPKTTGENLSS